MDEIKIKGARVHNLKNINLSLPKNKIIVLTGVSGSGKSSLAFDTIFAEGQRRYIESLSPYARQFLGEMKRADVDEINGLSPAIAIDQRALSRNPRSTVGTLTEIYDYLRVLYARLGEVFCPECGQRIKRLSLDEMADIILAEAKKSKSKAIAILAPVVRGRKGEYYQLLYNYLSLGYNEARIDGEWCSLHEKISLPRYSPHTIEVAIDKVMPEEVSRLSEAVESALSFGKGLITVILDEKTSKQKEFLLSSKWTCPTDNFAFPEIEPRLFSFNSPYGACAACSGLGKDDLFLKSTCPSCLGKRLRQEALSIKINGKNLAELTSLSIEAAAIFFKEYQKKLTSREKNIASSVLKEIQERLDFLLAVGLEYLSLDREAETLSGGEAQRIRLASQIGSRLSNTLYVLDEPTIGLHERDTLRLIKTLQSLRDSQNTVVVVEHDERTIMAADYLTDLGPWAGINGGKVVASNWLDVLLKKEIASKKEGSSLTLSYLVGKKGINLPFKRRTRVRERLKIRGARAHNLKNINVDLPLRKMICLTGVSGSGKSSLLYDTLYKNVSRIKSRMGEQLEDVGKIMGSEYLHRIVMVDQSPIGRTPRSNPATYTGIFTPIRDFFSLLEDSRARGYSASRFSFNVAGGRCEACRGAGYNLVEMHFLPPVLVECEVCHGKRFNRETLQVRYKNKNIYEVLEMTIDEAGKFFKNIPHIMDKVKVMQDVGLGYLRLGQSATTLSGGEAQRIKLARELTHRLGKRTLYLLDEPTVGLHYYDIEMLLKVLNRLVEGGNTVLVIEHNMHIIKSADYLIDLGPEGGEKGGRLVAKGLPEEVARKPKSITGSYLKKYL